MKNLIVGSAEFAEVATFYFQNIAKISIDGFVVDEAYQTSDSFCGKPVLTFQSLPPELSPDSRFFVAVGYSAMNSFRAELYERCLSYGWTPLAFQHPSSQIASQSLLGRHHFILENNVVQPFVSIGENAVLWSSNHIGHHSQVGKSVFLSSHVVVSSKVTIGDRCFLGVGSTLADEVTVGEQSFIGQGAYVSEDVNPGALVVPASRSKTVPSGAGFVN